MARGQTAESAAIATVVAEPEPSGLRAISEGEVSQQIATAKRFPRDLERVHGEILQLATFDEETAASCFYALPRGGRTIEGPSIRMAEILASAWGNMRVGSRIVEQHGRERVVVEGLAWDLEKNVAITAQVSRRVLAKKGRAADDDDVNLATMAGQAVARRNAILQVVPGSFIKGVMAEVRSVAVGKAETVPARRAQALAYLAKMGVTVDRVLAALERETVEQVTAEDVLTLRGMAERIKDGVATVEETFPDPAKAAATSGAAARDAVKAATKATAEAASEPAAEKPPLNDAATEDSPHPTKQTTTKKGGLPFGKF